MGAQTFINVAEGKTAKEAFNNATDQARFEHGHGGYTGTIAEKHDFRMYRVPEGVDPRDYVNELEEGDRPPFDDKWGPAGCVDLGDGKYIFFGSASS